MTANEAFRFGQCLERAVGFARRRVVQDGMALAERPRLRVLAGQADGGAVGEDGRKGQRLGVCPADADAGLHRRPARPERQPLQLGVGREAFRAHQEGVVERPQPVGGDVRFDIFCQFRKAFGGRLAFCPSPCRRASSALPVSRCHDGRRPSPAPHRASRRPAAPVVWRRAARDGRMRLDHLIHARLRVGRLLALVVAPAAVADQIDQKVFAELASGRRRPCARRRYRPRRRRR